MEMNERESPESWYTLLMDKGEPTTADFEVKENPMVLYAVIVSLSISILVGTMVICGIHFFMPLFKKSLSDESSQSAKYNSTTL